MITLKQIAAVLRNRGQEECISNVEISSSDNAVFSQLENRIDPKRPYHLSVTPDEKLQELRILVPLLFKLREDSPLIPKLFDVNAGLGCGSLYIEPSNSMLCFRIQHFCEDHNGATSEFFERLLVLCVKAIRAIEQVLLFETMLESGLPKERAELLVKNIFGDNFITNWNQA